MGAAQLLKASLLRMQHLRARGAARVGPLCRRPHARRLSSLPLLRTLGG